MTSTRSIKLSKSQLRFATLIEPYPWLEKYWRWGDGEYDCDTKSLDKDIGVMSHGERVLAQFFLAVWTGKNKGFDILEAASVLDVSDREMIAGWLAEPFWT